MTRRRSTTNDRSTLRHTHPPSRASERGATAIEYALMGSLIMLVIVAAVTTVGQNLAPVFTQVSNGLSG